MAGNVAYITGENKLVRIDVQSLANEHFVIKEATYKLTLDGTEILSDVCEIDPINNVVSCLLEPPKPGYYQLDVTCLIGPETFIFRFGVIAKC